MAGFLDKKSRVVDMVLTDYGKELYSKGTLRFKYYAFSDDEVDYDPWISESGSLSNVELTSSKIDHIEDTLVREAVFGRQFDEAPVSRDQTNIQRLMYTMPQGQKILPKLKLSPDVISGSVSSVQQKIERVSVTRDQYGNIVDRSEPQSLGYEKFKASRLTFDFKVEDFFDESRTKGVLIRIFSSGSDGFTEIRNKKDLENILSYSNDLRVLTDTRVDKPSDVESKKLESIAGIVPAKRK